MSVHISLNLHAWAATPPWPHAEYTVQGAHILMPAQSNQVDRTGIKALHKVSFTKTNTSMGLSQAPVQRRETSPDLKLTFAAV